VATNVFVSFDHDDARQVAGFRSLKANPKYALDFQDHSLREPVTDRSGRSIKYPPSDPRSQRVRDEIRKKFDRASKLVVLIGADTHKSEWVDWEVKTFVEMKRPLAGEETWKRVRGMRLKGHETAPLPPALYSDQYGRARSTATLAWDPDQLDRWLDEDLPDR